MTKTTGRQLASFLLALTMLAGMLPAGAAESSVPAPTAAVGDSAALGSGITYYIDVVSGSDENAGTSEAAAWRSFEVVNKTTFQPGDNILLKAGCVWDDTFLWAKGQGTEGNPITIGRYGQGNKPRINANGTSHFAVRLRDQEYMTIQDLEITNHSEIELAPTGDLRPYGDDEATNGALNRFPFGGQDFLVGILVTITAGKEADYVCRGITIQDNYIHDVNGQRIFHSPAMDGNSVLTWTLPVERGGFNTDYWKASGGISFTTEDPRPRQGPATLEKGPWGVPTVATDNKAMWGVPVGIGNAMPPNNRDDNLKKSIYDGVLIEDNVVQNVSETGIRVMQSIHLRAYTLAGPNDPLSGLHENVVIRGNTVSGDKRWSDFGIYWSATDQALVEHNKVSGFHTSGMEDTHAQFSLAQYNEVFNIDHEFREDAYNDEDVLVTSGNRDHDLTTTADGCAIDSDGGSVGAVWQYNYLHDNRDAMLDCVWNGDSGSYPTIFRYNLAVNTRDRLIYGGINAWFHNNVFYNSIDSGSISLGGGQKIKNNIFYLPSGSLSGSVTLEGNLYAGGLKVPTSDPKGIAGDPMFVAPGGGGSGYESAWDSTDETAWETVKGYLLQNDSPAIDAGVSVTDLTDGRPNLEGETKQDIVGNPLYADLPDIGFHEYSGDDKPPLPDPVMSLNKYNLYLAPGKTQRVTAVLSPNTGDTVSFTSSNVGVATVAQNGTITAVAVGTTTITATATVDGSEISADCAITVTETPVSSANTLIATDDAVVRGASADDTLGTATSAHPSGSLENKYCLYAQHADTATYSRYSMIQFDLSGVTSESVPKATVKLFLRENREANTAPVIGLYDAATGWSESTITWNNAKTVCKPTGATPVATWIGSTATSVTPVNRWVEFDVTNYINGKLADDAGQVSLVLAHTAMMTDDFLSTYTFQTDTTRKQMLQFVTKEYAPPGGEAGDCAPQLVLGAGTSELVSELEFTTQVGSLPALPATVSIKTADATQDCTVDWDVINAAWYAQTGSFEVLGTVEHDEITAVIATVTVEDISPATLSKHRAYLNVDDTLRLSVQASAADYPNGFTFTSGTVATATVDANGLVTAVAEGETVITATSVDQPQIKLTADIIVNATEGAAQKTTLPVTGDAYVRKLDGDTALGGAGSANNTAAGPSGLKNGEGLLLQYPKDPGYERMSYLKFDLPADRTAPVGKAEVKLYLHGTGGSMSTQSMSLYSTDAGWGEDTLTWNQALANYKPIEEAKVSQPFTAGDKEDKYVAYGDWVTFDVTEFVNKTLTETPAPAEEAPAEEAPAEEAPVEEAPVEEATITETRTTEKKTVSLAMCFDGIVDLDFETTGMAAPFANLYAFVSKEYQSGAYAPQLVLSEADSRPQIEPIAMDTVVDTVPKLPATVSATVNGETQVLTVTWENVDAAWYAIPSSFDVKGTVGNGVVIATVTVLGGEADAKATSIAVLPNRMDIVPGRSRTFKSVTSYGAGNGAQNVTWIVSGNTSGSTVITTAGKLTVGANETAEKLTVTATSGAVSGTAIVTIPAPALALCTDVVDFGTLVEGYTAYPNARYLEVANTGEGMSYLTYESDNTEAFRFSSVAYTLAPGMTTMLSAHVKKGLEIGRHTANVKLYSNGELCGTAVYTVEVLERTETPTTENAKVQKNSTVQKNVVFALTSETVGLWKVYSAANAESPAEGVTVAFDAEKKALTLTADGTDLAAGTYYISVTEAEKSESARLALTVEDYVPPYVPSNPKPKPEVVPPVVELAPTEGGAVENKPNKDGSVTYTFKPEEGKEVKYVRVNGLLVKATDKYTVPAGEKASLVVIFSDPNINPVERFTDLQGLNDATAEAVKYVVESGLFSGTGKGTFAPEGGMDRAMFATVLARLYGANTEGYTETTFTDMEPDSWYGPSVAWAAEKGYIQGMGGNRFAPQRDLTRQELAALVYRFAKDVGVNTAAKGDLSAFGDADAVDSWAAEAMTWAVDIGLIVGRGESLAPSATVTRAETAIILERMGKLLTAE